MRWLWFAMILLLVGCDGRPEHGDRKDEPSLVSRSEPHVAEIDLRRGAPERPSGGLFDDPSPRSFTHLVLRLRSMREEEHLRGIFVRLGGSSIGLARAGEMGRLLGEFRDKKLPVVCHANGYDNATMLLAALGCDEIWVSPAGGVETVGIAGQLIFGRSLLDRLSVKVDFLQVGKFKGASEPFTRDGSSPEARQSLEGTLANLRTAWLAGISAGRGKGASELGIEDGPYGPTDAKERSLIDAIGFEHEARKRALERAEVKGHAVYFGPGEQEQGGMAELLRMLSGTSAATSPHIAVVRATGAITMQPSGSLFGGGGISFTELSKTLKRLRRNEDTKAVVLRIDSPGGSALASDLLWNELMLLRAEKPLVVSIGGMAASGGYYLACAGTKIVADEASIVGSIGVVAGKLSFAESLAKIGVTVESVPADPEGGSRALYASALTGWDDATRAKVLRAMEAVYDLFIDRIAEGRDMAEDDINLYAEGRIMGGVPAHEGKMIDEIGGLGRALDLARELADLEEGIPVAVVEPPSGLLALLASDDPEVHAAIAERKMLQAERTLQAGALELLPFRSEVESYVASATPLLQGERMLTALPFALAVR